MSITPEMSRSRLANTNETIDSITSTAQWILFHKRKADMIAQEWAQFLNAQSNKSSPIYIANEVIQQSKMKRKGEFVTAFAPISPAALAKAHAASDLATRDRIVRVIKVWRDRNIFANEDQQRIENAINSKEVAAPSELQGLVKLFTTFKQNPNSETGSLVNNELQRLMSVCDSILTSASSPPNEQPEVAVRYTVKDALSGTNVYSSVPNEQQLDSDDDGVGYASEAPEENKRQKVGF